MNWSLSESLLKGVYLGLLLFVGLQEPSWRTTALAGGWAIAGLAIAMGLAAFAKLRQGYRAKGKPLAFLLFVLLDNPRLIYGGIVLGMAAAAMAVQEPDKSNQLIVLAAGGLGFGLLFWFLRQVRHRWTRIIVSLLLAGAVVAAVLVCIQHFELLANSERRIAFGARLLLGLPLFYLLILVGTTEETEADIGGICAMLGLSLSMMTSGGFAYQSIGLLLAGGVYLVYTTRILPSLRVFKPVLRGLSQARVGRYVSAFVEFRRALRLDPNHKLARESLWHLHRSLSLEELTGDPRMRDLIDADMCLDRVSFLLLQAGPSSEKLAEAEQLLDAVLARRPALRPVVHYWRAVARTHARQFDQAAAELEQVLDAGAYAPNDPARAAVLVQSWQLAVTLHPELQRRVGAPQLALPGRRLEAIAAVEGRLAQNSGDQPAWDLKRVLYSGLSEADYKVVAGETGAVADFDYDYAQQLGLALIHDPAQWSRGAEYLCMAARGLPHQAPSILMHVAAAQQRAGHVDAVWQTYEAIKNAGRAATPANLPESERQVYFSAVKALAEEFRSRGDLDAAIGYYQLYSESLGSGLETLRILADLFERKGDALHALRVTEQALLYNGKDKELLERKDRYYYSLTAEELRHRLEPARPFFDFDYCVQKSRTLMDHKNADLDVVSWAQHLAELALIIRPESLAAKVVRARALRRRGRLPEARAALEEVFAARPTAFASGIEEDSWYLACRLLGEAYLGEAGRPDLAVPCFQAYRKSPKSGADTIFKLGQAYEQLGDRPRAVKCYEHVIAYDSHPLVPDARDALYRLKSHV
jgi:tetratricopeptide (TPR) repeat protein